MQVIFDTRTDEKPLYVTVYVMWSPIITAGRYVWRAEGLKARGVLARYFNQDTRKHEVVNLVEIRDKGQHLPIPQAHVQREDGEDLLVEASLICKMNERGRAEPDYIFPSPPIAATVIGESIGLYDDSHAERIGLVVLHAVDIADVCDGDPKVPKLLKFTRNRVRGPIVQIAVPLGAEGLWDTVHYFLDEFKDCDQSVPDTRMFHGFHRFARSFGLSPDVLLALIKEQVAAMPAA